MADPLVTPLVALPGGWELVLIVLVIVLLFGAKKLPELARNTGRSLRIFKAETKGLIGGDDDDEDADTDGHRDRSTGTTDTERAPRQLEPPSPHGDPLREEPVRSEHRDGTSG